MSQNKQFRPGLPNIGVYHPSDGGSGSAWSVLADAGPVNRIF